MQAFEKASPTQKPRAGVPYASRGHWLAASLGTALVPIASTSIPPPSGPCRARQLWSGVLETLAFVRDPDFAHSRFERYGDVNGTTLLGQPTVFIRGGRAISDLFSQGDAVAGWWPDSVRTLLGPLSLANRNGADH